MVKYFLSSQRPNMHYVQIEVIFENLETEVTKIQLPSWRPGRYELQNFAQNVRYFRVHNLEMQEIVSKKITKDCWEVENSDSKTIIVTYEYFAFQLDAGASYIDENQIYINPCACFVYREGKELEPCILELKNLPENYKVAGYHFENNKIALFDDFHHFADTPFIASAKLIHNAYQVGEVTFNIWMLGIVKPNWKNILDHFHKFTQTQIELFGDFPSKEYHFICQLPNQKAYHGVEHLASTVLYFGPGYKLMEITHYRDFLGLASHELFHSWNIKSIRPIEMMPYQYSKENYSNLGYVAEGVTTYYGDLMLLRSGVYQFETYTIELNKFFNRHFHNNGRSYMTLAESSYDTWLDGYKPGAPDRKVNMYVKGMIVAIIFDVEIRKLTDNDFSLDTVMSRLYNEFSKKGKGYSEQDYLALINQITQTDFLPLFEKLIWGLEPVELYLKSALEYLGLTLEPQNGRRAIERTFGIKPKDENGQRCIIGQIFPNSPADIAGLSIGDEIIALNTFDVDPNSIEDIFDFFEMDEVLVTFSRGKRTLQTNMKGLEEKYFQNWIVSKNHLVGDEIRYNYLKWTGQEFDQNPEGGI